MLEQRVAGRERGGAQLAREGRGGRRLGCAAALTADGRLGRAGALTSDGRLGRAGALTAHGRLGRAAAFSSASLAAAAGRSPFLLLLLLGIICIFQQILCILVIRSNKLLCNEQNGQNAWQRGVCFLCQHINLFVE